MKSGTQVKFEPTDMASDEFKQKVKALGDVTAEVLDVSRIGVCTLLLPVGIVIDGHSHPFTDGTLKGRHYLDIHESHLVAVS